MNTYIIPIYDGVSAFIETVKARNLEEARDRIMNDYLDDDDEIPADWHEFLEIMEDYNIHMGQFYDISEF